MLSQRNGRLPAIPSPLTLNNPLICLICISSSVTVLNRVKSIAAKVFEKEEGGIESGQRFHGRRLAYTRSQGDLQRRLDLGEDLRVVGRRHTVGEDRQALARCDLTGVHGEGLHYEDAAGTH